MTTVIRQDVFCDRCNAARIIGHPGHVPGAPMHAVHHFGWQRFRAGFLHVCTACAGDLEDEAIERQEAEAKAKAAAKAAREAERAPLFNRPGRAP